MRRVRQLAGAAWDLALSVLMLAALAPALAAPYAAAVRTAGALGRFLLPRTPFAARIAENVALVRPDLQPRAVAAAGGDNFGRQIVEFARMSDFAARPALRRATGLEHLRAAAAAGRGALIVSAHFGNWDAIRLAARDAGVEVGIIYRRFNNPVFDWLARTRIRRAGGPVLWKGLPGQKAMLRRLRQGGAILVLLDQRLGGGPTLPFLGRPAQTAGAVAAMALKSGVPLIPAVAVRAADGVSFDVTFEPPVQAPDADAAMRAIHDRYAAWIDAAPGQWFWLHRRWKGVGENED
ncbi:MAG: lysophospholipid acyltransferase family protein [Rubrimonas sp.]